jgi:hypothetical protein
VTAPVDQAPGRLTADDAVGDWLTAGDPGPVPALWDEPSCEGWCVCLLTGTPGSGRVEPVGVGDGALPVPEAAASAPESVFWDVPGQARPAAGPSPLLAGLRSSLDALVEHGPLSGSRADTGALLELAERARALALRELAEMDATGGHLRPGLSSTTASWLRAERRMTDGGARGAVQLATALRDDLPAVGELLATGEISVEHAAAVVAGVRGLDKEIVREAQSGLCDLARSIDPADLRTRLRDKAAAVDDRIAAEAERRARERMGLRLSDVGPHTAVDGTLAGEDGAMVRLAMDLAVEADRADGDRRGKAARQADVLVRWASDYLHGERGAGDSLADDAHTVRTHLHVLCRPEQLATLDGLDAGADGDSPRPSLAELLRRDLAGEPPAAPRVVGDCGPLSRGALRRLACDATLDLVVLHSPGFHTCTETPAGGACSHLADPLRVGFSTRTVTGRQFRALVVRDRGCIVKGCGRRPAQSAAHHVRHWADGGPTDLDNLVLLCHQHHHDHHDRGMDLTHRDGRLLTQHGWGSDPPDPP